VVDTNVRRVIARRKGVRCGNEGWGPRWRDAPRRNLLPADLEGVLIFTVGAMELGAIVCTARCGATNAPGRGLCLAERRLPSPTSASEAMVQKKFEGSDRQCGLIPSPSCGPRMCPWW
jgi:A/G-specific adenine glycosylase